MNAQIEKEILVIGAGPTGLATALGLSQSGAEICCFGPKMIPLDENSDTRTIALFQGSIEFLKYLGVWENCANHATKLRAIRLFDTTKRLIRAPETLFEASELGLEAFGYNIPNAILTDELHKALTAKGPDLYKATEAVTKLEHQENSIIATTAESDYYKAQLVVGADGRKSLARESGGFKTVTWGYPQTALVCNFSHTLPHDEISNEFHCEAGPCTTVPLEGNNSSLVLVEQPQEVSRIMALDDEEFARELEVKMHGLLGEITGFGKRAQFPLSGLTAKTFAQNRIALVGEAAHVIPPIGAQGLNLGFRDAATLIETLRDHNNDYGSETMIRAYDRSRRADVWSRTVAVDLLNRTLLSGFLPVQAFRSMTLGLINTIGPLRRFLMRQGMQPDFGHKRPSS